MYANACCSGPSAGSLHPPEPANQEFDILRLPNAKAPNRNARDLRGRSQEFSHCVDLLFTSATRLRREISELPLTEVFSVQVSKEIDALGRLVKHLKSLASS